MAVMSRMTGAAERERSGTRPARILLSTGVGRLHFVETASALATAGVPVTLLTGWIPRPWMRSVANGLGYLLGRKDLYRRLAVRHIRVGSVATKSLALWEGVAQVAYVLGKRGLVSQGRVQAWAWKRFGAASCSYLASADVLHVRSGAGWRLIAAARKSGVPVIVDHSIAHPQYMDRVLGSMYKRHGRDFDMGPCDPFWARVLEDCEQADLLLVNSEFVRRTFVEAGYDETKIWVAYLGVRRDFGGLKDSYAPACPFRLLFTGNFCIRKGAEVVARTLRILDSVGFEYHLDIVGDASESGHLVASHVKMGRVLIHGSVPQDDLKNFLRQSDAYFFPTFAEGCAKSAMEAMAAGLPVITTPACGLPGKGGVQYLCVEDFEPESFAAAIVDLASRSIAERSALGQAGATMISNEYTWQSYAQSVMKAYNRVRSGARR